MFIPFLELKGRAMAATRRTTQASEPDVPRPTQFRFSEYVAEAIHNIARSRRAEVVRESPTTRKRPRSTSVTTTLLAEVPATRTRR